MKNFIILFYLFFSIEVYGQMPALQWAKHIGGTQNVSGQAICTDNQGNVYTTGYFTGSTDFDPGPAIYGLTAPTSTNSASTSEGIFISKLDANGNFVWAKTVGVYAGISYNRGVTITVDALQNVYVGGFFYGSGDFDPGPGTFSLTSAGSHDGFVLKLKANGDLDWVKQVGGPGDDRVTSIVADSLGNSYFTGYFNGTVVLYPPGTTYTLGSFTNIASTFIGKLDPAGNCLWVNQIDNSIGVSITLGEVGNIYTAGSFSGEVDFDSGPQTFTLNTQVNGSIFILKLNAAGNFVFAKNIGSNGSVYSTVTSIAVDQNENIYTCGYFLNSVDLDPGQNNYNLIADSTGYDIFISKLNNDGDFVWAKRIGSTLSDKASFIDVDALGNVYTTGMFNGKVDFDPGPNTYTLISNGFRDIFLSKLDAMGNFAFARAIKSCPSNNITSGAYGIKVDNQNNIYATGEFICLTDFDPGNGVVNLSPAGNSDMFILKMSQPSVGIIENKQASQINIYPNPAADLITIDAETGDLIIQLQLLDATGKIILEKEDESESLRINAENLAAGFYTIKIITKRLSITQKLIKH